MAKSFSVLKAGSGIEVRQYRGSLGYEIWRNGGFYAFVPTLDSAIGFFRLLRSKARMAQNADGR